MAPDIDTRTVAKEDGDPSSVLATYRRLLWLRRRHPALQVGSYRRLPMVSPAVFAYERTTPDETVVVAVNFAATPTTLRLRTGRRWAVIFDTDGDERGELSGDDRLTLSGYEAVILQPT
jgi:glycosidase